LYDNSVGNSELDHWIGPNRKDSLVEKINKLQSRQLPLLYNKQTLEVLKDRKIEVPKQQKVFFKGQLFIPYLQKNVNFNIINSDCLKGTYISIKDITILKGYKFHIPSKKEWLISPTRNVDWVTLEELLILLKPLHLNQKSPMCWMKDANQELEKIFITWW
jgi:hypothetical protein